MGNCVHCGKPAGWFKSRHPECQAREYARAQEEAAIIDREISALQSVSADALQTNPNIDSLQKAIENARSKGISETQIRTILLDQWQSSIDKSLQDGVIDPDELSRLTGFIEATGIPREEAEKGGYLTRVVKGVLLYELFSGCIPQRFVFNGEIPVNLQPGEKVIWGFSDTKYLEDRIKRERVGGSQGVSFRIMSGVYYRVGAFKGKTIETTERQHIDTGWLIITDRNLYFVGPKKSLRIPYSKIINFDNYTDGIGLMRDAQTAMPQLFITGDGWFTYNLVTNLAQR